MGFALGTGYAPIEVQRYGEAEPRLTSGGEAEAATSNDFCA